MHNSGNILVIGDIMLDSYIYGTAKRLSPEAPCPVLDCCKAPEYKLGGASNVAYQISQSGLNVSLWGVVGNDIHGKIVRDLIHKNGITDRVIVSDSDITTVKTRYLAENHQQLLRVDDDSTYSSSEEDIESLRQLLHEGIYKTVVISDYAKGTISSLLSSIIILECRSLKIPCIIDIKNSPGKYKGATVIKGNHTEFEDLFSRMGINHKNQLEDKLSEVCNILDADAVVMTFGSKGIWAYSSQEGFAKCNADSIPVHDVTGAGDVVTAFIAMLWLDNSFSFKQKVEFANIAAHKKVSQVGTGMVTLDDVLMKRKVITCDKLKRLARGKKIVFTNGCFDIIHAGHVSLLNNAKEQGDILVVGLNSDDSVKRLKGGNRPINTFECRAEVLMALSSVDYIIEFDEDTPLRLIQEINPSILVKGGDYKATEIIGYDYMLQHGGKVMIMPYVPNQSSSLILKTIGYE